MGARIASLLAITAMVGTLAACGNSLREEQSGGGGSSTSESSEADGKGITMAGVFCVCFINTYVAWKEGFFEKEGVPVKKFVTTKAGADTFQALAAGDVDFGLSGLDAIVRGQEKGVKVRSVATISPEFYALTVREQEAGKIHGPEDLKGRKVAVSKIGSASWAFLQQLMRKGGLSEGDVEVVQLGAIDTIMAGLKRGTVDAAITWEPGTAQAKADGFAVPIINALTPEDHQEIYGTDKSINITLATTDKLIENDPDKIRRVVRALDNAGQWIASHSPEQVADAIAPVAPGLDRELLVSAVKDTMATAPKSTDISKAAYESSANVLEESEIIESVPPLDEPFSCDFAKCTG
jgi:ABC-type nitrate/sulfonate/bicarbonate transport system substrate-binding protein